MEPPRVVPKKVKEWATEQPEAEVLPTLPFRVALLGPSNSGKTRSSSRCSATSIADGAEASSLVYISGPLLS